MVDLLPVVICDMFTQIAMAAMDVGDLDSADEQLKILKGKFPKSQRVRRLEGMRFEAGGNLTEAGKVYKEMLTENPANSLARKRQVRLIVTEENGGRSVAVGDL